MRRSKLLPLLLASLGAQAALAQSKGQPESPPTPTGKNPAAARTGSAPGAAASGERAGEPVAPAAKTPEPAPATPLQPATASAPKVAAPPAAPVGPPPASGLGPGSTPPPIPVPAQYPSTARVAITEFQVTGEDASRALAMRLQDGFVVGLNRAAPIYALDSVDVARYVDIFPELQKCEGAICIKRLGQMLDVSHILRVTVAVTGNSYDMTARLFSTEGQSPADVPVDTQTRFCPVCTVDEARQKIIQLGDAIKNPVELWLAQQRPPPQPPPPQPSSWRRPLAATGIALGFATIVAGGALLANSGHDSKKWPAVAGVLIGIGASVAAVSCYVLIVPADSLKSTPKVAIGGTF